MAVQVSYGISHYAKGLMTGNYQVFQADHCPSSYIGLYQARVPPLVTLSQIQIEGTKYAPTRFHENIHVNLTFLNLHSSLE